MTNQKRESENLGGNKTFENVDRENNLEVGKVGRKIYVIWNHKDSESIHFDPNHTNSNQRIPDNLTNIGSINDSAYICVIENMFSSPVQLVHAPYLVPAPPIFTYGIASDP